MTKGARTPEKLRDEVDEYFDSLGSNTFPDYAGMLLYLDLFPDQVASLCEENKRAEEYRRVFQYAELKRESWLARVAASDGKLSSGAFNLLKQQMNGGYTTVQKDGNKGSKLEVVYTGIPGGRDAFK